MVWRCQFVPFLLIGCAVSVPGAFVAVAWTAEPPKEAVAQAKGSAQAPKQETGTSDQYLRLARDAEKNPLALEAAIVRLAPADRRRQGPTVDLVSAVHVAEKSFYARLNREFDNYDVVLYEMIAPEGFRITKGAGGRSDSPVSKVQKAMTDLLELEFQLEGIDYTRKNMVHADMSPAQLTRSMKKRGDSVTAIFLRMIGYAMARQGQNEGANEFQILMALFDKDRAMALKRLMAEEFAEMGGSLSGLEEIAGATIIVERNKVALEVLRRQLATGKNKIAIFYGAGHMPDFQRRLHDEFGLTPVSTRWLAAWELRDKGRRNDE